MISVRFSIFLKVALIQFGFSVCFMSAQLIDDFDDSELSNQWASGSSTFVLTQTEGYLEIAYDRTATSGQWDQFRFDVDVFSIPESYNLMFGVWSNVATQISVKPVYSDGGSEWLQRSIGKDEEWVDVVFHVDLSEGKALDTIFFYLDGGSSSIKSGIIRMDDLKISTGEDSTALIQVIENAMTLFDNMERGNEPGQYAQSVYDYFGSILVQAKVVVDSGDASQEEIEEAENLIMQAIYVLERNQNREPELYGVGKNNAVQTRMTRLLFENLIAIAPHRTLFGTQDPTGYGVGWTGDNERSDVKSVCGAYPAFAGWGIRSIANGGDSSDLASRMKYFHEMGAVNSVEWHMDNLFGGNYYWDEREVDENAVASILPDGEMHEQYKVQLDRIASFFKNLRDKKGRAIPVVFRPFHECNGDWFWWGKGHSSAEEYKQLFAFTVNYLRSKSVMNMLVAYSTDRFSGEEEYLERYPGDDVVDIIAADNYWDLRYFEGSLDIPSFVSQMRTLVNLAEERGKVAALSECGYEGVRYAKWFTEVLLEPIKSDPIASRISYFAVWRNASDTHHYAPYPEHHSVDDFLVFYEDPMTLFIDQHLPDLFSGFLTEETILHPPIPEEPKEEEPIESPITFVSLISVDAYVSLELSKTATSITIVNEAGVLILAFEGERDAVAFSLSAYLDGLYGIQVVFLDGSRESLLFRKTTPVIE